MVKRGKLKTSPDYAKEKLTAADKGEKSETNISFNRLTKRPSSQSFQLSAVEYTTTTLLW